MRPKICCKNAQTRRRYFQACCANFLPVYTSFLHFAVKNDIYDEWMDILQAEIVVKLVFWWYFTTWFEAYFGLLLLCYFFAWTFCLCYFLLFFTTMWVPVLVNAPLSQSLCFTYIVCASMFKCCVLVVSGGKHGNCGCQQIGRRVATANHPVPCIRTKDLGNCTKKLNKERGLWTQ